MQRSLCQADCPVQSADHIVLSSKHVVTLLQLCYPNLLLHHKSAQVALENMLSDTTSPV